MKASTKTDRRPQARKRTPRPRCGQCGGPVIDGGRVCPRCTRWTITFDPAAKRRRPA